jgi:Ni/Co efflux regulator RcnB
MQTLSKGRGERPGVEPWRTGPEIAKHYRVDPATVRNWRRQGMPSHRRGYRLIFYRLSEVDEWLQQREEPVA